MIIRLTVLVFTIFVLSCAYSGRNYARRDAANVSRFDDDPEYSWTEFLSMAVLFVALIFMLIAAATNVLHDVGFIDHAVITYECGKESACLNSAHAILLIPTTIFMIVTTVVSQSIIGRGMYEWDTVRKQ